MSFNKVLDLEDVLAEDQLATAITEKWIEWDMMRQLKKQDWEEIRRYVFATDTTQTSNSKLPWKNKTTIPKLCQIRDNLNANYSATLFPQRKSVIWEANEKDSASVAKRDSIQNYMTWVMSQPSFKHEMEKVVLDYIDYGNCMATVEWIDQRIVREDKNQGGYVGPGVVRISPLDIVCNPTSSSWEVSPKIVRSLISLGDLKKMLESQSNDDNRQEYEEMWNYLYELRNKASNTETDWAQRDNIYSMEGFTSFREYLNSETVEVLTFYGDIFDVDNGTFLQNHIITVVDRHKLVGKKPNPSYFGYPPIFHAAWRKRQDNLWGMGPLDNLVGMQYRMDHVENLKADVLDLVTFPVQKIKGFVEDYTWEPGAKIWMGDEGDVDMVVPDVQALNANFELQNLERLMEEMAGAPKEAMGFRTPGEKTKYEVQRLENAAARIFQNKIRQFEEQILEPLLNAMLELARRNMTGTNTIKVFDNEFNLAAFESLTVEDITGIGRIKPVAARHFAEQAEMIQNISGLSQSNIWPFVQQHFSAYKLAKLYESIFNLDQYEMVQKNVALAEQAEAQQESQVLQEQNINAGMTASGMGEDFDMLPQPQMGVPQEGME